MKTITIEGKTMALMAKTQILPAALRYQAEVAHAVTATKAAGVDSGAQLELLQSLAGLVTAFQQATAKLDAALGEHPHGELLDHTRHSRDSVLAAMTALRGIGDQLEAIVADDLWPLPTYREMLFIK